MKPYFSIVMPTYGVEKYIEKAILSVQNQTYTDWELIVVDDCTPDQSAQIAAQMAKEDSRIRIVTHQENQGLSAARNTGLQEACGQYIWFMDPDDYVDEDLLATVYQSLQENPAKLVVFGLWEEYYEKDGTFSYRHAIAPKEAFYSNQESLRRQMIYLEQATLYGYAWNKIYDLEYLRSLGLRFENVKLIEDIVFNVEYCMEIDSMNLLPITAYHYQKRLDNSLTNKFVGDYYALHRKRIDILYRQYQLWGMCTEENKQILGSLYGRYILSALQRNCDKRSGMDGRMRRAWFRKVTREDLFQELIPYARATDSRTLPMALRVLRSKSPVLCTAMGRAVYIARNKLPMFYSKVKSAR